MSVMASRTVSSVPDAAPARTSSRVRAPDTGGKVSAPDRFGQGLPPRPIDPLPRWLRSHAMSTADTKALIEEAVASIQKEVPALQKLKLVMELELRGRGDTQLSRAQAPGPKIPRDIASAAKARLSVPRSHFNELAKEGKIRHWREAFESG